MGKKMKYSKKIKIKGDDGKLISWRQSVMILSIHDYLVHILIIGEGNPISSFRKVFGNSQEGKKQENMFFLNPHPI